MQCIDGGSIADRLTHEQRLPIEDAVRVMREVASALMHAHKRGVIHRDIKPANVLVDAESGRSLVTDFGIARSGDAKGLTATGTMIGTAAYLSPKQITGDSIDHRVDIYALGVMAHEMLTGRVPFDGATPTAAMLMRLGGPPAAVTTLRADVPQHVADVITRCLAADQADRYASADEVLQALDAEMLTTGGRSTRASPVTKQANRATLPLGVAALAIVLAGAAWWMTTGRPARRAVGSAAQMAEQSAADDVAFVTIAEGEYTIGNDSGPALVRPQHVAHVAGFRLERTEVTVDAYDQLVITKRAPSPWGAVKPLGTLPVTRVTWGDAENYSALKYPNDGRLPTEVEWEAAARGVAGRTYPYGNTPDGANTNTISVRRNGPAPVGSFPRGATPEGLQDMSGNVWEWTSSPWQAYPGATPLPKAMLQYRVFRGGAFDTQQAVATGWIRGYLKMTSTSEELPRVGFRCARSAATTPHPPS